ncbi:SAM domain-containing SAMSN-1-like isoform X1 [Pelobates cultripes]|uniref:SAM domain-containing SAMSN-1-like isoform X1 n=2 Tax=Pelobates cultripes TaxID=61616 RepID=A0AAD1VJK2_PELCU|nr:SAM domain-containing SAMSN-1-like isoform X1 [Pelobates cultripes]
MNLFCFSLEGSMDSLYEPVQNAQDSKENTLTRACNPLNSYSKMVPHERSLSLEKTVQAIPIFNLNEEDVEFPDLGNTDAKKRRKRSLIQKSVSENEAFDRKSWPTAQWQNPRRFEYDSYLRKHCHIEDLSEDDTVIGDRINVRTRKHATENMCQVPSYEQRIPCHTQNVGGFANESELDDRSESMGTLKRLQKLVRSKKSSINDDVKHPLLSASPATDPEEEDVALTTCMKLTKSQEKKSCKDNPRKKQENDICQESNYSPSDIPSLKWNTSQNATINSERNVQLFSEWKSHPENVDPFIYSIIQNEEWEKCICCNHHSQLSYSLTDMDLPYSWRTSSFGTFDRFRKPSSSKHEELHETGETESVYEGVTVESDKSSNNAGSLSKKMKAISLTMRKKMGKKYSKALSEDMNEDDDGFCFHKDSDPGGGLSTEKVTLKSSESVESLYSLNSGQSSSSGVTSCSDGTSNRDSFRLDEYFSYSGPFCGRARVHTDFIPSPYDMDSLKIKKGDIIDIIVKTPMGIWTGMLNNKVGNFKFIYVDVISEEEVPPRKTIVRKKSKRPRPKTLQELMERLNLQDYISSLLLNGYETLEDLKDLKESHLSELNITNPEDRTRMLVAIENLQDCESDQQLENTSGALTVTTDISASKYDLKECPRDSGCYISMENSESNKEDVESDALCESVTKITITESA